jgi:proton-translocating NAD(P)+ transhydrogenase subunit beta
VEQLRELVPWVYFIAAITFIFGLKGLSGPTTAQMGNRVAAAGMLLAVIATFLERQVAEAWVLVLPAIAIGTVIGFVGARQVPMTAMPQMVAIFNGAGGGAAALVSILEYMHAEGAGQVPAGEVVAILLGLMIGAVSFSGSIIAFGKLQGLINAKAFKYAGQQLVTGGLFGGMILLALALVADAAGMIEVPAGLMLTLVALLALAFGVALVMPIGGADMPVVISLLNAYTGLAVAMAGFSIGNQMLIVAGTLVGASGTILTRLMSKAMNRSLTNVLFGAFGAATAATAGAKTDDGRSFREVSAEDAAILLGYAQSVIIVPGYGLAVAQAQHNVRELADLLEAKGVDVKYAIHPVAGRMPGHMNVLLAEANVPYEKLFDMEQINEDFQRADVALVIGANDVTNPAARKDTTSPIYGMPILNVDQAQNIIVIKRSMKPGFAGIDNELYLDPKTGMLFGDAKEAVSRVVAEVKKSA